MDEMMSSNTTSHAPTKNWKPVYTIADRGEGQKEFWCRIGIAFVNRDGSLTVKLDAMPVNGKLHIRDENPYAAARRGAPPAAAPSDAYARAEVMS